MKNYLDDTLKWLKITESLLNEKKEKPKYYCDACDSACDSEKCPKCEAKCNPINEAKKTMKYHCEKCDADCETEICGCGAKCKPVA
jgi:hypothetical protein